MGIEDDGNGGGRRDKISHLPWLSDLDPAEVERRNLETNRNRGIHRDGGELNRNALLAGIDPELIGIARKQAQNFLEKISEADRLQAERLVDSIVRTTHPEDMIALIQGIPERVDTMPAIPNASIALAFLTLTEGY